MNKKPTTEISGLNQQGWRNAKRVKTYSSADALQTPERIILENIPEYIRGGKILDIGVGCGRTTPYLTSISKNYIGMDYSPEMVECCRQRFPDIEFMEGNACDLTRFHDGSFDLICFSYNGIDCVDHEDRLRILSEIYRVLNKGGIFIFSSHNLDAKKLNELRNPWKLKRLSFSYNPFRLLLIMLRYFSGVASHIRLKKREVYGENYAILNDQTNGFTTLMYYIRCNEQFAQLEKLGFKNIQAVNLEGRYITLSDSERGIWIDYSAFK